MRYRAIISTAALLLGLAAQSASSAVWYVARYSPGPAHDGKSWASALTAIQQAVSAAAPGDDIWVGFGSYSEAIALKPGVGVYGGFIGYEFFRDQRVGIQGLTTIVLKSGSTTPAVNASGAAITPKTAFDGFTLSGGSNGLICVNSSPTISHNVFLGNAVAIEVQGGSPVIADNVIASGTVLSQRPTGAITITSGSPVIVNNTIVGNGGCAVFGSGTATIVNNIIAYNAGGIADSVGGPLTGAVRSNCIYGNMSLGKAVVSVPYDPALNLAVDPKFAVYAYGNLHLAPDSPCRNAGDDSVVSNGDTDLDFQPRIQGAHVDIGADESDGRVWTFAPRIVRVSPTGNDANDGSTWALAKKTLVGGITLAAAQGGDVWVQSGTYASQGDPIQLPPYCYLYGGFAGTETAFGQRDWAANPTFISGPRRTLLSSSGGYRVSAVDGFVLTDASMYAIGCLGGSPFVRNNVFMRNSVSCVKCAFGNPLVTNNAFVGNTDYGTESGVVSCTSGGMTVSGNAFIANGGGTSATGGPAVYCGSNGICTVTDNLFDSNMTGTAAQSAAAYVQGIGAIANNTFVNTRGTALSALAGTTVANNIFAFNDTGLSNPVSTGDPPPVRSNCFYGNGKDYANANLTGKYGNIQAYPYFSDLFEGDYRLLVTSRCVDAGDDSVVSPGDTDLDGKPRILGLHVDIGCYETNATSMVVQWSDVTRALKIAGGLLAASADERPLESSVQSPPRGVAVGSAVTADRHRSGN